MFRKFVTLLVLVSLMNIAEADALGDSPRRYSVTTTRKLDFALTAGGPPVRATEKNHRTYGELLTLFKTLPLRTLKDPATPKKIDQIMRMALNRPSASRSVFLLYYNSADSRAGFSHGAIWMDGRAYETFPHPQAKEKFYKISSIPHALEHQRADYGLKQVVLPTAILEIPNLTKAQKAAIRTSITSVKSYAFFNGGGRSAERVNCMGIHYQALKAAKLPLPKLKTLQVMPLAMIKQVARSIPGAQLTGELRGWLGSRRLPHFSRTTLHAVRTLTGERITRLRKNIVHRLQGKHQ